MSADSNQSDKEALLRLGQQRLAKRRKAQEYFRRMKQSRDRASLPAAEKEEQTDLNILLMTDDEQRSELLRRLLSEHGFQVLQADDLRSALTQISQEIPELLIVELVEGAAASLQILRQFHSLDKLKELPILVILSPKDSEHEERFCHTPNVKVILRPFTPTQIAAAMQDLLDLTLADAPSSDVDHA